MTNDIAFMIVVISIAFGLGLLCGMVKEISRPKPHFTPMRFTKEKQKVLIVRSVIARKPEEMEKMRNKIQKQLQNGLVMLPCGFEYSFGEVTTNKIICEGVKNE